MSTDPKFPQSAAVETCIYDRDGTDRVSLVATVRQLLRTMEFGHIEITGPRGAGKTTALRHLAHALRDRNDVEFPDWSHDRSVPTQNLPYCIYTRNDDLIVRPANASQLSPNQFIENGTFASLVLAPWERDDWIEYLLDKHPNECASVMDRVRENSDMSLLNGSPAICAMVLDALAANPNISDIPCLIAEYVDAHLPSGSMRDDAMKVALAHYLTPIDASIPDKPAERLESAMLPSTLAALLNTETIQLYLASRRVRGDLRKNSLPTYFGRCFKPALICAIALAIDSDRDIRKTLRSAIRPRTPEEYHAVVASILVATSEGWRPNASHLPNLEKAHLVEAKWERAELAHARLRRANLSCATMRDAELQYADLVAVNFTGADLSGACLRSAGCSRGTFINSDLRHCRAESANFHSAQLIRADFTGANLDSAMMMFADCRNAKFIRADLSHARFAETNIDGADFTNASLEHTDLGDMDFRNAIISGTTFANARCARCNFEEIDFPHADFSSARLVGALFTGANMPHAIFEEADLRDTGLFEINWENADLRGVDFRGASFHAGSSRSGLVDSPIASEGTRTGFYTDDYLDQSHRAPEEIRVANLRGSDLRGANIFETDFYLVDLRDAKFHPPQEEHLRKCGAILEARV